MNKKEKLIEIIQNAVGGCARNWADIIATALIESNEVIVPPVKVGDMVYVIPTKENGMSFIEPREITYILEGKSDKSYCSVDLNYKQKGFKSKEYAISEEMFGTTVFLTKEEAEQALKKDADKTHEQLSNPKIMNAIIKTMIKW